MDLTVADAVGIRDFYQAVTGWEASPVSMGDYEDFCMIPPGGGEPVAGLCHARGANLGLPPVWLPYIIVTNLDASMQTVKDRGGEVVQGPKAMGPDAKWCVIRDPAGAHAALFQQSPD
jgi:predicted enzyme related to lactoylglutathione lyase